MREPDGIDFHHHRLEAQNTRLVAALRDATGWLNLSDVQYLISHKHGEQAALHQTLNTCRALLKELEG